MGWGGGLGWVRIETRAPANVMSFVKAGRGQRFYPRLVVAGVGLPKPTRAASEPVPNEKKQQKQICANSLPLSLSFYLEFWMQSARMTQEQEQRHQSINQHTRDLLYIEQRRGILICQ